MNPTAYPVSLARCLRRPQLATLLVVSVMVAGCASPSPKTDAAAAIRAEMESASATKPAVVVPPQISDALQVTEAPIASNNAPAEARFDLIVNNATAREVFLAMVTDTRYSMLMHPGVDGSLSVTLRGVTVREALEAIRDVYGYDFKIDGRRITIYPPTLQTRIFTVNYLNAKREGKSEIRVSSGAASVPGSGSTPGQASTPPVSGQQQQRAFENSRLATTSNTDFWGELGDALRGIVGAGVGRNVVVSAQSGVVAVRAMPEELRQVEAFLKATRVSVERQVMLEAKIVEVQLRDGFQSGIDWTLLRGTGSGGVVSTNQNRLFPLNPSPSAIPPLQQSLLQDATAFPTLGNGLFGLVFSQRNFTGVLSFLETQGNVHILSSPRVSAMNNQKAVLKVGTDEYFVTGVTGGTVSTGATASANTTTLPTITLSSFFSGIALDVMPQIDQGDTITLHVHPSVSSVTEVVKVVDLGGSVGSVRLPLPANSTNETDTVVRVTDGNIVAIGGLMQLQSRGSRSGLPGSTNVPLLSNLLGNQEQTGSKREIVVLIKPTIIRSSEDWREQARETKDRLDELGAPRRIINIDGMRPTAPVTPK